VISAKAQTFPNAGFETWTNFSVGGLNLERPNNWYGTDSLVAAIAPQAAMLGFVISPAQQIFKSSEFHAGTSSVEVRTVAIGSTIGNAPGVFSNAQIGIDLMAAIADDPENILDHLTYTGGTSVNAKVDTVFAWVKTGSANLDTAIIQISALSGTDVELGAGEYRVQPGNNQFVEVAVPITYTSTEIPSKLLVAFISSDISAEFVHEDNALYVDDVSYTTAGPVSVRQPLFSEDQLIVYPNPANDVVYFNLNAGVRAQDCVLTVTDVTGKVIFTEQLKQQINAKNVSAWAKGNYFFNLTNTATGKFENGKISVK